MSPLDLVLSRLDKPRELAAGKWRAACPGHGGSNRTTLAITAAENGAVLMTCFHGCTIEAVAAGLGLDVGELFPPKPREPGSGNAPMRLPFIPAQVFDVTRHEAQVVAIVASDIVNQREVTPATLDRVHTALRRLDLIGGAAYGRD